VLGVREAPGRSPTEALAQHLEHKKTLLVLDNCEHLIDACAELVDTLLRSCPKLHILATSREALGVGGEIAWLVPPLSLPDPGDRAPVEELGRYEGIRLFHERARSVAPTFELGEGNAPSVARLCRQLEGVPLAIQLAAARTRVFSVEQILKRLEDTLKLLAGSDRTAPESSKPDRLSSDLAGRLPTIGGPARREYDSVQRSGRQCGRRDIALSPGKDGGAWRRSRAGDGPLSRSRSAAAGVGGPAGYRAFAHFIGNGCPK
jgi:predicted ATPase